MRKNLLILVVCIFAAFTTASAQIRSNRDLVGKWQGADMKFEFFADAKVIMVVTGGKLPIAGYSADFMKNPIPLNITLTQNGQKMTYKGLMEFRDNETIRLQYFGQGESDDSFAKGRTVTLKKIK